MRKITNVIDKVNKENRIIRRVRNEGLDKTNIIRTGVTRRKGSHIV